MPANALLRCCLFTTQTSMAEDQDWAQTNDVKFCRLFARQRAMLCWHICRNCVTYGKAKLWVVYQRKNFSNKLENMQECKAQHTPGLVIAHSSAASSRFRRGVNHKSRELPRRAIHVLHTRHQRMSAVRGMEPGGHQCSELTLPVQCASYAMLEASM